MRLGTKITILSISTFLITICIGAVSIRTIFFLLDRDRFSSNHPFHLGAIESLYMKSEAAHDPAAFARGLPQGVEAAVIGDGHVVLASNFAEIPVGSSVKWQDFFSGLMETTGFSLAEPMREPGQQRLLILHLHDAQSLMPSPNMILVPVLTLLVLLLIVSVVLTRGMLGSTYKAIASLSSAASRITAGELDFRVTARGNDELGALAADFDRMRGALREDYDRRARFLMGVSHDLKTPLTSIRGYIEAMQDGLADDPQVRSEYLKVLDAKSQLLEDRLVELLDFGRMETGEWKLKLERIPLCEFLVPLCRQFEIDARLNGRMFVSRLEIPEALAAAADLMLFARVIENLAGNAIRYTRPNDRIELSARPGEAAGTVSIEIRDSGPGIEPRELALVFEPFFRGTRTRSEPGFGLGLSIVRSIVEAHGWSINAESQPEGGTTFRLTLPTETA